MILSVELYQWAENRSLHFFIWEVYTDQTLEGKEWVAKALNVLNRACSSLDMEAQTALFTPHQGGVQEDRTYGTTQLEAFPPT